MFDPPILLPRVKGLNRWLLVVYFASVGVSVHPSPVLQQEQQLPFEVLALDHLQFHSGCYAIAQIQQLLGK